VNDTSLVDGRNLFAPEVSLVNIDNIWAANASTYTSDLLSASSLGSRAQALVNAGAAVNLAGASAILNATIDLATRARRKYSSPSYAVPTIIQAHSCDEKAQLTLARARPQTVPVSEFIAESFPGVLAAVIWPLTPLSRGWLHIRSADPLAAPHITPRLLSDPFDQAVGVATARRARALFASAPFAGVVADAYLDPPIGPNGTDAEYLVWLRNTSFGASHWIGSTAMLPRELGGVVDARLRSVWFYNSSFACPGQGLGMKLR
jgi:choline dehydrogenase